MQTAASSLEEESRISQYRDRYCNRQSNRLRDFVFLENLVRKSDITTGTVANKEQNKAAATPERPRGRTSAIVGSSPQREREAT
jgi:hypothetical protein